jgi:hypothetical protein
MISKYMSSTHAACHRVRAAIYRPRFTTAPPRILRSFDPRRLYANADPATSGTFPVTTTAGGWMPVVSLWNESFDPFGSDAQRAVVVSVGPPSLCAAGYACGAGSSEKTGLGTLNML